MVSGAGRLWSGCCLLAFLMLMGLTGCTSIAHVGVLPEGGTIDWGPRVELRICLYKDADVSRKRANAIVTAIQKEFDQYGLDVQVLDVRAWQRPSFKHEGILRDIAKRPLEPPFDRNFALVGRDTRDFLWGALLPEILGAVETRTHTKGYVVAEMGSFNQLLTFKSPTRAAVHEFYHLLGVDHDDSAHIIREKIAMLKRAAIENRFLGRDFFPGISSKGTLYLTRRAVDKRFGLVPAPSVLGLADTGSSTGMRVITPGL